MNIDSKILYKILANNIATHNKLTYYDYYIKEWKAGLA